MRLTRREPRRSAALFYSFLAASIALGSASQPAARADARTALPPSVGAFKLTKPVVVYTPANLETHVDGEAEAIKHFDFRADGYGEYAPGGRGNQLITVDVFQFGSPTDAYGYYSDQRNARAQFLNIGAEGYQEATALNFWKGPYYVRIANTANNPPPSFNAEMRPLAQAIAAKLPGPATVPPILKLLPPGYAPRTEQYRRADIAGQAFIRNGVVAKYPSAGPQAELFVAVFPAPAAAHQAYNQYVAALTKPMFIAAGAKPQPVRGLGDAGLAVKSRFRGQIVTAVKGKYLIGVSRARDAAAAQKLVQAALGRL